MMRVIIIICSACFRCFFTAIAATAILIKISLGSLSQVLQELFVKIGLGSLSQDLQEVLIKIGLRSLSQDLQELFVKMKDSFLLAVQYSVQLRCHCHQS